MINVKDEVYAALSTISENVTDFYPRDWEQDTLIQFMEEDNKVTEYTDMGERKAYCRYRIDIWAKKSTSGIALEVDRVIAALGLKRTQCMDMEEPSKYKHKQMRYEMIIDVKTKRVYHS